MNKTNKNVGDCAPGMGLNHQPSGLHPNAIAKCAKEAWLLLGSLHIYPVGKEYIKVFLGEKFIYSLPTYQSFHSVVVITSAFNAIKKLDERSCGAIQRYNKLNKIRSIDSVI